MIFTIAKKLPLGILALALLVGAGVGSSAYVIASKTAQDLTFARLAGLAADRSDLLRSYLMSRGLSVMTAARSETIQNAVRDLHFGWLKFGDTPAQQMVDLYVTKNPYPKAARTKLVDSLAGTNYDSAHARVHPALQVMARSAGFEDIYLFDNDGNAIYTVNKGSDFGGGFAAGGSFGRTVLGSLLSGLKDDQQAVSLSDVAIYGPNENVPSAFMAAPVLDKRGGRAGSIAVRLPIAEFSTLINRRDGLGQTGEVLIVGADHLLRSESNFSPDADVLQTRFDSAAVDAALGGTPAEARVQDSYRSEEMLVDAAPLRDMGIKWAVVTMMGTSEAMAPVAAMGWTMLACALVLMIVAGLAALFLSRKITSPITKLTRTMASLAQGQFDQPVPFSKGRDEIGDMARAVEVFRENGVKVARLTEAEATRILNDQQARAQMMSDLQSAFGNVVEAAAAGDFTRTVEARFADAELNGLALGINNIMKVVDQGLLETGAVLGSLAEADLTHRMEGNYKGAFATLSQDINQVTDRLSSIVSQLRLASSTLSAATTEILAGSNNLSTRTAAQAETIERTSTTMNQLAKTVRQNADRAKEASEVAARLMRNAEDSGGAMASANNSMESITASSHQISGIIGLIDDIAFQTNLLALNASVEAARAGDAGQGFAVVAVEVRRLAQSAAKASADVKKLIERSADEVRSGSNLVLTASSRMAEMLSNARSSADLVGSIALESGKQASAIDEVSASMRTLEVMTQHNSSLVEETNAAISTTELQVAEMDRLVDLFTIRDQQSTGGLAKIAGGRQARAGRVRRAASA
ncbi:MAG: methyl-accepting chemotaxis protein [Devosia sp.]